MCSGAAELPTNPHLAAAHGRLDSASALQTGAALNWFMLTAIGDFWCHHTTTCHLPVLARVTENDWPDFLKISGRVCGLLLFHAHTPCGLWAHSSSLSATDRKPKYRLGNWKGGRGSTHAQIEDFTRSKREMPGQICIQLRSAGICSWISTKENEAN